MPLAETAFAGGMTMDNRKIIKTIAVLIAPLLLFAVLFVPYCWVNQNFIVEWLGCGCPKVDASGQIVYSNFNANDFTALFWYFITACVTAISVFTSKRIPKEKMWLRILYIVCMFAVSLLISHKFCQMMLWD